MIRNAIAPIVNGGELSEAMTQSLGNGIANVSVSCGFVEVEFKSFILKYGIFLGKFWLWVFVVCWSSIFEKILALFWFICFALWFNGKPLEAYREASVMGNLNIGLFMINRFAAQKSSWSGQMNGRIEVITSVSRYSFVQDNCILHLHCHWLEKFGGSPSLIVVRFARVDSSICWAWRAVWEAPTQPHKKTCFEQTNESCLSFRRSP